ncbi:tyrosine--tRNA ligase [Borreliella burgdorferi]|uniref:Tyrosine--tRNA ligase n=2 Tax=Borreliella burgdorferi TaxID=139 RepID=SYY_BORBU|nr:tyrosine--tRNA ligase [Borreliella burgdorferi]B7J1U2.1 RecName: Full=Tyrosine--tRNA ligase; AltName: Full=Tyrosyl-tRNA synthetase; Short=TyrRS [Borreliella burgdorferi ZS7]O51343.1 RecName: Full=Tyrosine--tRNA ligase; AltName: Full=Tyrosyl-tRNA synthetase; Short=TyrRS [Borreliella burgdorferi B31]AAC66744.1 tyrosyl-tRNA synthetase [Borreliella burgdorferi B31]ACK75062.1 tyrosyl-tRNA synthetase [Borreliella burgdorferi ZS7]ARS30136.1 tyrosine--tRNA ligase [Borreliella burgdorferi]ARS33113.
MNLALSLLHKRGFLKQCTSLKVLSDLMDREKIVFYAGVDATSSSLHIGHLIPFLAMMHLRQHGHMPIVLIGDSTAKIGDPSGKSEMRKILSSEEIGNNALLIKNQLQRITKFTSECFIHNSNWLDNLNYIEFLRDVGMHFSVNRMLSFETYKRRMDFGLSFIEFNYQLLQSYDYYMLNKIKNCRLQIGGDDQWGNIISGVDLIRKKNGSETFGLTFPLITRSDGKKMGKSEKGAVYLDSNLFSIYDFYQYFRNTSDSDVKTFLYLFTFLEEDEIELISNFKGNSLNKAKEILAFEITKIVHGEAEALKVQEASFAAFRGSGDRSNIPFFKFSFSSLKEEILLVDLMLDSKIVPSKSEGRRLIDSGGVYINGKRVESQSHLLTKKDFNNNEVELRVGKKKFLRIVI